MKRWYIAAILVALDQVFKFFALGNDNAGIFVLAKNTGVTFGLLQGTNTIMIGVSVVALLVVGWVLYKAKGVQTVPLVMLLAGIIGNGIDRVVHGAVIDYIRIGTFPIFNFADSMIVTGVIIVLLLEIPFVQKKLQNSSKSSRPSK